MNRFISYEDLWAENESLRMVVEEQRERLNAPPNVALEGMLSRRTEIQVESWRQSNEALMAKLNEAAATIKALKANQEILARTVAQLREKNDRAGEKINELLKALRFYADADNYNSWSRSALLRDRREHPFVSDDQGKKAREAIAAHNRQAEG